MRNHRHLITARRGQIERIPGTAIPRIPKAPPQDPYQRIKGGQVHYSTCPWFNATIFTKGQVIICRFTRMRKPVHGSASSIIPIGQGTESKRRRKASGRKKKPKILNGNSYPRPMLPVICPLVLWWNFTWKIASTV